jgi:hypothetical protein
MSLAHHLPPQPAAPTINLNGSDGQELFEDNRKLVHALDAAVEAMLPTAPHARDYLGHREEFARAREEHWQRVSLLRDMIHDLDVLGFLVKKQLEKDF